MTDWPLSTVKAKPTHGRKKYIVVFFPHSRVHCWADISLVCSINELPEPLAYGTHFSGMEMVKDLTVPRRYIMQKLAVAMLNVSDHLHTSVGLSYLVFNSYSYAYLSYLGVFSILIVCNRERSQCSCLEEICYGGLPMRMLF